MNSQPIFSEPTSPARALTYNAVWRWHFYAGLFCLPFAIWLAITGAVYLFKPQIEPWLYSRFDNISITGPRATPSAQVAAALAAVPGTVLNAYELPLHDNSAVQVIVGKEKQLQRVYVHPQTLEILDIQAEDERLMRIVSHLHGELLLGDAGSMLIELAASWMIVLIITGLYLWWPRTANGLAGVVYPRLSRDGRTFWRDLHAVTGLWVAFFVLFILVSGLPWAKSWGGMLKQVRQIGQVSEVKQDWVTSRTQEMSERLASNTPPAAKAEGHGDHEGHRTASMPVDATPLDVLMPSVQVQQLAPPVLISPPSKANGMWSARSNSQNRSLRATLKLDSNGAIITREDFAQRPLLDRIIGYGIAAHEGQLFGWFNQLLGVITVLGVLLMSISCAVMWWSRRAPGTLGAPRAVERKPLPVSVWLIIFVMAGFLPLLGLSLLAIVLLEFAVLQRIESVRQFLSLG